MVLPAKWTADLRARQSVGRGQNYCRFCISARIQLSILGPHDAKAAERRM